VRSRDERVAFVRSQTILAPAPLVPELVVLTATPVTPLWHATAAWLDDHDAALPFWSVPWAGGQALARWVLDHPESVRGLRVIDFACGGGIVAIAAAKAGAASVRAIDIDPLAEIAATINAEANGVRFAITCEDVVGRDVDADVLLCGDVWYEKEPAERFARWFAELRCRVITGDPARAYVPPGRELARYDVPTPVELEGAPFRTTRVVELAPGTGSPKLGSSVPPQR
jgi:predicted nicotinamide N-methyase